MEQAINVQSLAQKRRTYLAGSTVDNGGTCLPDRIYFDQRCPIFDTGLIQTGI